MSPLFDVVTTSVYRYENQRTGIETADRTMALKLNKAVSYPTRNELEAFGRNVCHVQNPAAVIERIADAMSATLAQEGERMPGAFVAALRAEWDAGRFSVEPARVFGRPAHEPARQDDPVAARGRTR